MIPRLKSGLWVEAFMRTASLEGCYCTVVHKGNAEAGQIYLLFSRSDGTVDVLSPPPGPSIDDDGNRRFELAFESAQGWSAVNQYLDRKRVLDSDIWTIEIEARQGFCGIQPERR
jgi:hypothetical protein